MVMVNLFLPRKRLATVVGFGWWLSLSFLVGVSRSLSTGGSVSTGKPPLSSAGSKNTIYNENDPCSHYKWLIVGGGIHGVGIAARLIGEGKICVGSKNEHENRPGDRGELLVVDEHPALLHSWKERTRAIGMAFLRSSSGFHLDVPARGLLEFAGDYHTKAKVAAAPAPATRKKKPSKKDLRKAKHNRNKRGNPGGIFIESDYQRPALELFNDHCDLVVDKYGLDDYFFRGRVESIFFQNNNNGKKKARPARVVICTGSDDSTTTTVSADNIVLAVGNDDPLFPEWATDLVSKTNNNHNHNHKISHLLQIPDVVDHSDYNNDIPDDFKTEVDGPRVVAIIGGGISAVHKALQLTSVENMNNRIPARNDGKSSENVVVHIVSRHAVREQQFDTHQDWMMTDELAAYSLEKGGKGLTKRQREFRTIAAPTDRREVIKRERIPGTVPTYMTRARGGLDEALSEGKLHWHVAGVAGVVVADDTETEAGRYRYELNLTNGDAIAADEIILATGLGKRPPGHRIIHPLAEQARLPLSPCGYPLVDPSLQWNHQSLTSVEKNRDCNIESECESDGDGKSDEIPRTSSKIFVSGGLAELELGPSARNIAGARMAAERIAAAVSAL